MPPVPILHADAFRHRLSGGRTRPCVLSCQDGEGHAAGEYVVKLSCNLELGGDGQLAELVASKLASHMQLPVAAPAIVYIDPAMARAVPDLEAADWLRRSAGPNFGSEYMSGGFTAWPIGSEIPTKLLKNALDVFVFDLLIENPDRIVTHNKPNLLVRGEQVLLIDHELAFSFLYSIGVDPEPWLMKNVAFAREHIFYQSLSKLIFNYENIQNRILTISEDLWSKIETDIPTEWRSDRFDKMRDHVHSKVTNVEAFITRVKEILR